MTRQTSRGHLWARPWKFEEQGGGGEGPLSQRRVSVFHVTDRASASLFCKLSHPQGFATSRRKGLDAESGHLDGGPATRGEA